jgi:hypothetical protein
MAAGSTYTPIATQTLSSAAASVTFSSIPGTYTDLVVLAAPLSGAPEEFVMQFNSDTASNYSSTLLWGDGTTAGSYRTSSQPNTYLNYYGSVGTTPNTQMFNIMNYANTTTYKTVIGRAGRSASGLDAVVALWRSTAAISTIAIKLKNGNNFTTGSIFTIYGIAAA